MEAVRAIAGPALLQIASKRIRGGADRFRRIEAQLRDRIHARRLTQGPLGAAIDAARRHGVEVDLMDDAGRSEILPEALRPAREHAAALLDAWDASDGAATVRLALRGSNPILSVASREGRSDVLHLG